MQQPPILVVGNTNVETTLPVERFPIAYTPVNYHAFAIASQLSGVGYNVAQAMATLGREVRLATMLGRDPLGQLVQATLAANRLDSWAVPALAETPQSVVLFDSEGRRQVNTDLKDLQQQSYPDERIPAALAGVGLAIVTNANFARPFLVHARAAGIPIATDVQAIADPDDGYNRDFLAAATILFMSHERLPLPPEEWMHALTERYAPEIIVVGLGSEGALLALPRERVMRRFPTAHVRPVVSTVGAGDALFAAFNHLYLSHGDPERALRQAMLFAGYKVGERGGSRGFLDSAGLEALAETWDF